ncbi:unnamed protein product [Lampetra fluviatilis]
MLVETTVATTAAAAAAVVTAAAAAALITITKRRHAVASGYETLAQPHGPGAAAAAAAGGKGGPDRERVRTRSASSSSSSSLLSPGDSATGPGAPTSAGSPNPRRVSNVNDGRRIPSADEPKRDRKATPTAESGTCDRHAGVPASVRGGAGGRPERV